MALVERPHGLWDSPLLPQDMAAAVELLDVGWDTDGSTLVWLEERGGRGILVAQRGADAPWELNPTQPARGQVGYGGGDFTVSHGQVVFVDQQEARLYVQPLDGGRARPVTPAFGAAASPVVAPDGRWVAYVHSVDGVDCLAVADMAGRCWPQQLACGADFYMQPVWHRGGARLAWIEWDHPQMPWDGTRLVLADLRRPRAGGLPQVRRRCTVWGGTGTAVFQPCFSPDGRYLAFAADTDGWSRLHLYDLQSGEVRCLSGPEGEVGQAAWDQGMRSCSFAAAGDRLYFTCGTAAGRQAWVYRLEDGRAEPVAALAAFTQVDQPLAAPRGDQLAAIVSSPAVPPRLVVVTGGSLRVRARPAASPAPPAAWAAATPLTWHSADGAAVHGIHYAPTSRHCRAGGMPPLIVLVHGGPTSRASTGFDARAQYFATRGYAVLQVDYRGSTGYGREYAQALYGHWGEHDVADAVSGTQHLAALGLADPARAAIMGGSAGGFTVLRALALHPGTYRAGVCLYGISNLFALATGTHKFEARYLDALVGPLPAAGPVYRQRSPLFHAERIQDPVAVFHGSQDRVVPPAQAEAIVASLRARGVPHEYHLYDGEGHGWRRPETIVEFYSTVESFLRRHLLFS